MRGPGREIYQARREDGLLAKNEACMRYEYHSRVNTAWRPAYVQVVGEDVFGQHQVFDLPEGHFRCRCGNVVRIDVRGFAACELCGQIYNDGGNAKAAMSNRERKRQLEKLKYDSRQYKR